MLQKFLTHPLTKGLQPDDPRTTLLRKKIIKEKGLLRKIYAEWYADLIATVPNRSTCSGEVLELGSGGGFLKELMPECITSEMFPCGGIDRVIDARKLPFLAGTLRAVLMVDVFHHIPDVAAFLNEADRVLAPGGVVAMWEPWNTLWSKFIYQHLHSEPFLPDAAHWTFPSSGPLSGANGALPWMVFERDAAAFSKNFPTLRLETIRLDYPFSYLASGGVSMRALLPGCLFTPLRYLEHFLSPLKRQISMFSLIVLRKL